MSRFFFIFICRSVITSQLLKIFPVCVRSDFRGKVTKCELQRSLTLISLKDTPGGKGFCQGKKYKTLSASQKVAGKGCCGL